MTNGATLTHRIDEFGRVPLVPVRPSQSEEDDLI